MSRDIIVNVGFNEDEYLAMATVAESEGLSHSALLRTLAKARIRSFAITKLSADNADQQMPENGRAVAYNGTADTVSILKGAM